MLEEDLLTTKLEETNQWYAVAKISVNIDSNVGRPSYPPDLFESHGERIMIYPGELFWELSNGMAPSRQGP